MAHIEYEMLVMRNAHTTYGLSNSAKSAELGPISPQGEQEAADAAEYFSNILGGRSLKFYASPLTFRSRSTALHTAARIDQDGAPFPIINPLFVVPRYMEPVGNISPEEVSRRECEAVLTLESHLESVKEIVDGNVLPVAVMSGRALWLYFGLSLDIWPTIGNGIIPTSAIIHTARDKFTGEFTPYGHKADELASHLKENKRSPKL